MLCIYISSIAYSQTPIGNKLVSTRIGLYSDGIDTIIEGDSCYYIYSKTNFLFPSILDFYNYRSNNYLLKEENMCYLYDTCKHIYFIGENRYPLYDESFAYHYNLFGIPDTLFRINSTPAIPYYKDYSKTFLEYDSKNRYVTATVYNNYSSSYIINCKDSIYRDSAIHNYTQLLNFYDSIHGNILYTQIDVTKDGAAPNTRIHFEKNLEYDSITHLPSISYFDSIIYYNDANQLLDSSYKIHTILSGTIMEAYEKRIIYKDTINNINYDTSYQIGISGWDNKNLYVQHYLKHTDIDSIITYSFLPLSSPTSFDPTSDIQVIIYDKINHRMTTHTYNLNISSSIILSTIIDSLPTNELIITTNDYYSDDFDSTYIKYNEYNQLVKHHNYITFDRSIPNSGFSMLTDYFYDTTILSIFNSNKLEAIAIYPNPAKDYIYLDYTNDDFDNMEYIIIDNLGNIIQKNSIKSSKDSINISSLSSGIYFVIINNDNHKLIGKIVKI